MAIGSNPKKVFKVKKCPKNSKFLVLKYIKVLEFLKNSETFLNKGTKLKEKNHMEGINSKNKNMDPGGSL